MHTYIHKYMQAYMSAYLHAYLPKHHLPTYQPTYIHTNIHTHTLACKHTHTRKVNTLCMHVELVGNMINYIFPVMKKPRSILSWLNVVKIHTSVLFTATIEHHVNACFDNQCSKLLMNTRVMCNAAWCMICWYERKRHSHI